MKFESPRGSVSESPMTATSATPMISSSESFSCDRGCSKVGEAVGGTAAVICCFPFAVINLVVMAFYKVPSGLCKRAWNKKKKMKRKRLLRKKNKNSAAGLGEFEGMKNVGGLMLSSDDDEDEDEGGEGLENGRFEEEMLGEFYRGFWRSPSQKGD